MLVIEVQRGGHWYTLALPNSIRADIQEREGWRSDYTHFRQLIYREDHPELDKWMASYGRQEVLVQVTWYPDIKEAKQKAVQNILQVSQNAFVDDDSTTCYGY